EIRYGIDDPNCPNTYSGAIVVGTMTEGSHTLHFKAVDNVENEEGIRSISILLDITSPVADTGDDLEVVEGNTVTLDGSGSNDGASGSGVDEYTWTFVHDGSTITLDGVNPTYEFDEKGSYIVTLTVRDKAGHESTDTVMVKVEAQAEADSFWWILLVLIVVVVSMLLMFALFKKKKKKPGDEEEERECEECGHVLGPHDRVCPECDSPVAIAPRR
ncbi:MAG: PKD domain-containing protein, partial [Thermoplasmata archaeon]|nr:PKD domain-containing protein [Thermoplasmata archaeon]